MFTNRIPKHTQSLLALIHEAIPTGTYLAGGTALALYLDHRQSFDLDLYDPSEFEVESQVQRFAKTVPDFELTSTSWQTIHGRSRDTEISLFHYSYDLLEPNVFFEQLPIASLVDIAAMKIEAIAGRGLKRDFFDLYCLANQEGWSLKAIIDLNQQKFERHGSNLAHILKSLTYFDDAENLSERSPEVEASWGSVKAYFLAEAPKLLAVYV